MITIYHIYFSPQACLSLLNIALLHHSSQYSIRSEVHRLRDTRPYCLSMKFLLNERERAGVDYTLEEYARRYDKPGEDDPDLFVHLGDNPSNFLRWSGASNRLPTFRTGSGKYYNPHREIWMLAKDKLACLGLPINEEMARNMRVPGVPVSDHLRTASVAGNSFHFCTSAVVQMITLSCFSFRPNIENS